MSREVRLQKFIADCGVTSRRKAEDLITEGRVRVNGQSSIELGTKVDPSSDVVEVDGQAIDLNSVNKVYIVMHSSSTFSILKFIKGRFCSSSAFIVP